MLQKKEVDHHITTTIPFNFTGSHKIKNDSNRSMNIVYRLITSVKEDKTMSIRVASVKNVLKILYNIYYEKSSNLKESKVIENQTLAEYLYDSLVHKYGLGNLAETKIFEILRTVKTCKNMPNLMIFGRFLALSDTKIYSIDDLKFFFYFNKQLVAHEVIEARPYFKMDYNFEAKLYNTGLVLEAVKLLWK